LKCKIKLLKTRKEVAAVMGTFATKTSKCLLFGNCCPSCQLPVHLLPEPCFNHHKGERRWNMKADYSK